MKSSAVSLLDQVSLLKFSMMLNVVVDLLCLVSNRAINSETILQPKLIIWSLWDNDCLINDRASLESHLDLRIAKDWEYDYITILNVDVKLRKRMLRVWMMLDGKQCVLLVYLTIPTKFNLFLVFWTSLVTIFFTSYLTWPTLCR